VSWTPRRRFWRTTAVRRAGQGYGVHLDDRALQTPGKVPLVVPSRALAEAIAGEWDAVAAAIEPERLPFTRAANSAIDRVAAQRAAVASAIACYGECDLLCYRAEAPEELLVRQAAAWDPWLDWATRALGAPLLTSHGVVHRAQPASSVAALRDAVSALGPFELTALHELVSLSGSLVLGLAVSRGSLDAARAWELSRIDEAWQIEHWGLDAEAEAAAERARSDFLRAEALLVLLGERTQAAG
jgi:chaperone required for assembly of F1-ATPase